MTDDSKKENSIIPISSNNLVRVENSIEITNKIISEHEEKLIQGAFTTVKIENQEWMTNDLDVDCYANGDPIPQVQNPKEWENLKTGAWCYYNNDIENGKILGKLYNWYAVNDPRGLAPKGWRISSYDDWNILTDYLGRIDVVDTKMKITSGGIEKNNGTNETNESSFSGLSGCKRGYAGTFFTDGLYWSNEESEFDTLSAICHLFYTNSELTSYAGEKTIALSVRCLRV